MKTLRGLRAQPRRRDRRLMRLEAAASARSSSSSTPSCRRHGLVVWTGGNVSARDPETGLVAIKPSGVRYEDLTRGVDGRPRPRRRRSSRATTSRARTRPATCTSTATAPTSTASSTPTRATRRRSPRSAGRSRSTSPPRPTSSAARSRAPASRSSATTAIGRLVVEGIGSSPAILLKNHGVFTVGPDREGGGQGRGHDRGRRRDGVHGPPAGHARRDPARRRRRSLHDRYTNVYGQ